jgi:hypothetical protein
MPRDLLIVPKKLQPELIRRYNHSAETGESAKDALIHYFNPYGAGEWWISEALPLNADGEPCAAEDAEDWHMFGFAFLGDPSCAEYGYVLLSQLREVKIRIGSLALPLERELHWTPEPLAAIRDRVRAAA